MDDLNINLLKWDNRVPLMEFTAAKIVGTKNWLAVGYLTGIIAIFFIDSGDNSGKNNFQKEHKIKPVLLLSGHKAAIAGLFVIPSTKAKNEKEKEKGGERLLSISEAGDISVWDVENGQNIHRSETIDKFEVLSTCISIKSGGGENSGLLFVIGKSRILIYRIRGLELLYTWKIQGDRIRTLCVDIYSTNTERIFTFTRKGWIKIYEFDRNLLLRLGKIQEKQQSLGGSKKTEEKGSPKHDTIGIQEEIIKYHSGYFTGEQGEYGEQILFNLYKADEFVLLSLNHVKLFEISGETMSEKMRWAVKSCDNAKFVGVHFLAEHSMILWNSNGTHTLVSTEKNDMQSDIGTLSLHGVGGISGALVCCFKNSTIDYDKNLKKITSREDADNGGIGTRISENEGVRNEQKVRQLDPSIRACESLANMTFGESVVKGDGWNSGCWKYFTKDKDVQIEYIVTKKGKAEQITFEKVAVYSAKSDWDVNMEAIGPTKNVTAKVINDVYALTGYECGDILVSKINDAFDMESGRGEENEKSTICLRGNGFAITGLNIWCGRKRDKVSKSHVKNKENEMAGGEYVFSGSKDCIIRIWALGTAECLVEISALTSPVVGFRFFEAETEHGFKKIKELVVCIGKDNSVAVISLMLLRALYIIPPLYYPVSSATLSSEKKELKIVCSDDSELVIELDQEYMPLLNEIVLGEDTAPDDFEYSRFGNPEKPVFRLHAHTMAFPSAFFCNLSKNRMFECLEVNAENLLLTLKEKTETKSAHSQVMAEKVLSRLLCWGANIEIDKALTSKSKLLTHDSAFGYTYSLSSNGAHVIFIPTLERNLENWKISSVLNTKRILLILVLVNLTFAGNADMVVKITKLYTHEIFKHGIKKPDPIYLIKLRKLRNSTLIRKVANSLLKSTIYILNPSERKNLASNWIKVLEVYTASIMHSGALNRLLDHVPKKVSQQIENPVDLDLEKLDIALLILSHVVDFQKDTNTMSNLACAMQAIINTNFAPWAILLDDNKNSKSKCELLETISLAIELLVFKNYLYFRPYIGSRNVVVGLLQILYACNFKLYVLNELAKNKPSDIKSISRNGKLDTNVTSGEIDNKRDGSHALLMRHIKNIVYFAKSSLIVMLKHDSQLVINTICEFLRGGMDYQEATFLVHLIMHLISKSPQLLYPYLDSIISSMIKSLNSEARINLVQDSLFNSEVQKRYSDIVVVDFSFISNSRFNFDGIGQKPSSTSKKDVETNTNDTKPNPSAEKKQIETSNSTQPKTSAKSVLLLSIKSAINRMASIFKSVSTGFAEDSFISCVAFGNNKGSVKVCDLEGLTKTFIFDTKTESLVVSTCLSKNCKYVAFFAIYGFSFSKNADIQSNEYHGLLNIFKIGKKNLSILNNFSSLFASGTGSKNSSINAATLNYHINLANKNLGRAVCHDTSKSASTPTSAAHTPALSQTPISRSPSQTPMGTFVNSAYERSSSSSVQSQHSRSSVILMKQTNNNNINSISSVHPLSGSGQNNGSNGNSMGVNQNKYVEFVRKPALLSDAASPGSKGVDSMSDDSGGKSTVLISSPIKSMVVPSQFIVFEHSCVYNFADLAWIDDRSICLTINNAKFTCSF